MARQLDEWPEEPRIALAADEMIARVRRAVLDGIDEDTILAIVANAGINSSMTRDELAMFAAVAIYRAVTLLTE